MIEPCTHVVEEELVVARHFVCLAQRKKMKDRLDKIEADKWSWRYPVT
jgi:hypothetical protein